MTATNVGVHQKAEFRDWNEFFSRFSAPESVDKIKGRLQLNFQYYAANYAAIVLLVFIVTGITMPKLLATAIIPAVLVGASYLVAEGQSLPGGLQMNDAIRYTVGLISAGIAFLSFGYAPFLLSPLFVLANLSFLQRSFVPFLWTLLVGALLCGTHAVLKERPALQANLQKLEKKVGENLDAVSQNVGQNVDSMIESASSLFQQLKRKAE